MKPRFASMFLLKLFLLSLHGITINAKLTKPVNNKLLSEICLKTKSPEKCLKIVGAYPKNHLTSSLHGLGIHSLSLAILRAKTSANVFHTIMLGNKDLQQKQKDIYKKCRQDYAVAIKSLADAKIAWNDKKYSLAIKSVEVAHQMPISCEKALVGAPSFQATQANEMSDIIFDIPLLIAKEMVNNGHNKTDDE